jgi:hypothetical protein
MIACAEQGLQFFFNATARATFDHGFMTAVSEKNGGRAGHEKLHLNIDAPATRFMLRDRMPNFYQQCPAQLCPARLPFNIPARCD